jgi:nicotinamidase-related amidase
MGGGDVNLSKTALLLVDLQNDFLSPEGAYGRAGQRAEAIAALPARLAPLADAVRAGGGWVVTTQFTLVPGKGGAPFIAPHLAKLRPFLGAGDFAPGSWGNATVDELQPVDIEVEKVAYNAFHQSRLEFVLRKAGVERLIVGGIVTNGGVESTVRGAHVLEFETLVLSDGCAAFSEAAHDAAMGSMATISPVATVAEALAMVS